jgi:hypothetical protein
VPTVALDVNWLSQLAKHSTKGNSPLLPLKVLGSRFWQCNLHHVFVAGEAALSHMIHELMPLRQFWMRRIADLWCFTVHAAKNVIYGRH